MKSITLSRIERAKIEAAGARISSLEQALKAEGERFSDILELVMDRAGVEKYEVQETRDEILYYTVPKKGKKNG